MVRCPPERRWFGLEPLCRLAAELRCVGRALCPPEATDSVAPFAEEVEFGVLLVCLSTCLPGPKTPEYLG